MNARTRNLASRKVLLRTIALAGATLLAGCGSNSTPVTRAPATASSTPSAPFSSASPSPASPTASTATYTSPPLRFNASAAYDGATNNVVLFGGYDNTSSSSARNDTWTSTGTTWTHQNPATSPPARGSASIAYDGATSSVVLFGGFGISNLAVLDDTWTWDGSTWTQQHPATSPPARYGASMAYDSATGAVVLFSGSSDSTTVLDDTWTWDGTTWTEHPPSGGPPAMNEASMSYDDATSSVVLFTGRLSGSGTLNGTWTWDGSRWTQQHPATSPSPRYTASMANDGATGDVVLFGGFTDSGPSYLDDTWTWNGTTWAQQHPATSPPHRDSASMVYDSASKSVVLFCGESDVNHGAINDEWIWNGTTWSQQSS